MDHYSAWGDREETIGELMAALDEESTDEVDAFEERLAHELEKRHNG